jgi:hypothetical protein
MKQTIYIFGYRCCRREHQIAVKQKTPRTSWHRPGDIIKVGSGDFFRFGWILGKLDASCQGRYAGDG